MTDGVAILTRGDSTSRFRASFSPASGGPGPPKLREEGRLGAPKPLAKAASPHFLPRAKSRSFGTNNGTAIRNRRK